MLWWYSLRSHQTATCRSPVLPCLSAALCSSVCTWKNSIIHGTSRNLLNKNKYCSPILWNCKWKLQPSPVTISICKVFYTFTEALLGDIYKRRSFIQESKHQNCSKIIFYNHPFFKSHRSNNWRTICYGAWHVVIVWSAELWMTGQWCHSGPVGMIWTEWCGS